MEGIYLNLKRRIHELPVSRLQEVRESLNKVYDDIGIANKFNRWKKVFIAESHTEKMYALEAKAVCDVLEISLEQFFDPHFSFLHAHLKLVENEKAHVAHKLGLKMAS